MKYNIDLDDKREKSSLKRYLSSQLNNKPIYEVNINLKEPLVTKMKYVLIDGVNGDILFETDYYTKGNRKNPFDEYLESLKK